MTNIVVLNSDAHRELMIDRRPAAAMGDNQRFVQVILREFPLLAAQYPILLSKNSETGAFFCGAMLGFDAGENLFLKPDGGYDGYRPLNLQRDPFYYVPENRLALDLDSPRLAAADGERLFQADGRPSEYLQSVMGLFHELRPGLAMTQAFIDTLLRLKLLTPLEVELSFDDGSEMTLQDLYTIREDGLRALPDNEVLELFRSGHLYSIHLMLSSVKQIATLARRKNERLAAGVPQRPGGSGW